MCAEWAITMKPYPGLEITLVMAKTMEKEGPAKKWQIYTARKCRKIRDTHLGLKKGSWT